MMYIFKNMWGGLVAVLLAQCFVTQPYQSILLDPRVLFTYSMQDTTFVTFTLTCKTLSWCAIGFGSAYPNADIIRLQATNAVVSVVDMHARPNSVYVAPGADEQQDVTLVQAW
jgi:hypothetical protein